MKQVIAEIEDNLHTVYKVQAAREKTSIKDLTASLIISHLDVESLALLEKLNQNDTKKPS